MSMSIRVANYTNLQMFVNFSNIMVSKYDLLALIDSSHQNGPVERQYRTVADGMRAMLLGANLDVKFWPYAFKHYVRIRNSLPSRDQDKSPTEIALGQKDNFKG